MKNSATYDMIDQLRVKLIAKLEKEDFIFQQDPKVITKIVQAQQATAYDKIFIRADKIDSNGKLIQALEAGLFYIKASKHILYTLYFIFGFFGALTLLANQKLNFFYLLAALLGWHSLSFVWWLASLFRKSSVGLFDSLIDKLALHGFLAKKFVTVNPIQRSVGELLAQQIHPVKKWFLSSIMHANWLFALLGSTLGILGLFLFKSYHFVWESTLLNDQHFLQMMAILGFIPAKLGFGLPELDQAQTDRASFAWFTLISLILYGFLPRLLAFLYSQYKAKIDFRIDLEDPYYRRLLAEFSQSIIDKDDYKESTLKLQRADKLGERIIIASLERPLSLPENQPSNTIQDMVIVDSYTQIQQLVEDANKHQAQIYLLISTGDTPDRGILRKLDALSLAQHGLVVHLIQDNQADHLAAWQDILAQKQILQG